MLASHILLPAFSCLHVAHLTTNTHSGHMLKKSCCAPTMRYSGPSFLSLAKWQHGFALEGDDRTLH